MEEEVRAYEVEEKQKIFPAYVGCIAAKSCSSQKLAYRCSYPPMPIIAMSRERDLAIV